MNRIRSARKARPYDIENKRREGRRAGDLEKDTEEVESRTPGEMMVEGAMEEPGTGGAR